MFEESLSFLQTSIYYMAIACVFFVVCQKILAIPSLHAVKYYIKYGLFHILVTFIPSLCIIPALFRPGSADNALFVKLVLNFLRFPRWFGVELIADGTENFKDLERPFIIVSNHQTSLDMLAVQEIPRSTAALAKRELLKIPIFGFLAWLCGTIFIDRKSHKETVDIMKDTAAKLKKYKTNVWIFPEGTRKQIDGMLPFKKGAFHLAVQAQVPIIPVVISNCRSFIDVHNRIFESGIIRLKVLPPMQTEGLKVEDVPELTNQCRDLMLKTYNQMFEEHKEEYIDMKPLPKKKKEL